MLEKCHSFMSCVDILMQSCKQPFQLEDIMVTALHLRLEQHLNMLKLWPPRLDLTPNRRGQLQRSPPLPLAAHAPPTRCGDMADREAVCVGVRLRPFVAYESGQEQQWPESDPRDDGSKAAHRVIDS